MRKLPRLIDIFGKDTATSQARPRVVTMGEPLALDMDAVRRVETPLTYGELLPIARDARLWLRYPLYDSPDQVAIYGALSDALAEPADLEPREEIASLALADVLGEATFEHGWTAYEKLTRHTREQLLNGTFSSAGLGSLGVFGARAPLGS